MSRFKRLWDFSDFPGFCKRNNPELHHKHNMVGKKPHSQFRAASRPLRLRDIQNEASREIIKPES